jgi:hypothetical protein
MTMASAQGRWHFVLVRSSITQTKTENTVTIARSLHSSKLVTLAVVLAVVATGCAADGADEAVAPPENVATTSDALSLSQYWWSLPWRGGSGGAWTGPLGCASGDVIVGIHVRAHTYVDQLGLICSHLYGNGTFGPRYTTPAQGGGGGDPYYLPCPDGQAVIGFYGRAKTYLDRIGIICGVPRGNTIKYVAARGGDGGDAFEDWCPSNYVMRTVELRVGSLVDAIRGNCNYLYP